MVFERAEGGAGVSSTDSQSDLSGGGSYAQDEYPGEEEEVVQGVVLWSFEGGNEGELGVTEGTRVLILGDAEEWLFCEFEGERGYVPRAYVEPVEDGPSGGGMSAGPTAMSSTPNPGDPADGRKQIAFEILSTEENYLKCLEYISVNYKSSLEAICDDEPAGLDRNEVKKMFSNIESIKSLNQNLHTQLKERLDAWDPETCQIGDIFAMMAPVLIIYTEYANQYQQGLNFYNREKKKNERFASVCDEVKSKVGMDLEHLLIMPVQRVPRYNLLLEDLYKNTPDDHCDKANLAKALENMQGIAVKINDCMRQTAKVRELTAIASKTTGLSSLLEAHRRLIRDTVMTVTKKGIGRQAELESNKHHFASSTEKMQVILFNDLVIFVPKAKMHDPLKFGQQVYLHLVWMTNNRSPNQFDIFVPGFQLTLQFDEKKQMGELQAWIKDLTVSIDDHLKKYWKEKLEAEIENTKNQVKDLSIPFTVPGITESNLNCETKDRFGDSKFPDGASYNGWWNNGVMNGFGEYSLHGNDFQGLFEDGLQSGLGKCSYYTGDTYFGNWATGLPNGRGDWVSASNDKFTGEFLHNRKHGKGEMKWANGDRFVGVFKDDEPNGHGELVFASGLTYKGDFEAGLFHGKGVLISPTGKNYSGDWVRGERCGNGVLKYSDGSFYAGRWNVNQFHGSGTLYNSSDGCMYVGEFVRGVREGDGTILNRDKSFYAGQFKNDNRHGKGSYSDPVHESYIGAWRRDYYHGSGKLIKSNGVTFDGTFEMGVLSGSTQVTAGGKNTKVSMPPSHISDPRLSYECPPRPASFNARAEFYM